MNGNQAAYRQWSAEQQELPIYFRPWYLDSVCAEGLQWDAVMVTEKGRVAAVWPYAWKRKSIFRYATQPPLCKMLGPRLSPELDDAKHLHRLYPELIASLPGFDGFTQALYYDITNWLPFYWAGFQQTTRYTYLLDLSDLEAVEAGFNRNIRRNIRKAEEKLHLRHDLGLEELYRLQALTFERQKLEPPFSLVFLQRHWRALEQHGAGKLFFALDDQNRVHAASMLIWDERSSYYHIAGEDPALRDSGAGIWLHWAAIRYSAVELGVKTFDFEGSMLPHVEPIRRQFGAVPMPYFEVWSNRGFLFGLLDVWRRWRKRP